MGMGQQCMQHLFHRVPINLTGTQAKCIQREAHVSQEASLNHLLAIWKGQLKKVKPATSPADGIACGFFVISKGGAHRLW